MKASIRTEDVWLCLLVLAMVVLGGLNSLAYLQVCQQNRALKSEIGQLMDLVQDQGDLWKDQHVVNQAHLNRIKNVERSQ